MIIVPLLLEAIAEEVREKCMNLPDIDGKPNPYSLSEVKTGRYYQDPSIAYFRAAVLHGDLESPSYPDGIFKRMTHDRSIAMDYQSREIGGGEIWLRRGTVRFELFFLGQQVREEDARDRAYVMADNIFNAVKDMDISVVTAHNESAHSIFCVMSEMLQTGGPPSSWIFRGKFYWEVQTEVY